MKEKTLKEAVIECKDFFGDLDKHIKLLETNTDFREHAVRYVPERKLYLEIDVKHPEITHYLHSWLYQDKLLFGCKLHSIHFQTPGIEIFKSKLNEFLKTL